MKDCDNCGTTVSILEGVCTEQAGRICDECMDDVRWRQERPELSDESETDQNGY